MIRRVFAMPACRHVCAPVVGALVAVLGVVVATPASADTLPGPYATILFSRTEMTGAANCVPLTGGVARLDTDVAPYLQSLGMVATGTLTPDKISQSADKCTHYNASEMASWDEAKNLADNYGWTFVSHTASYPSNLASLSPAQSDAETCGSADTITAHGLPGANGYIAYPDANGDATALQTNYGSKCFAWGRKYGGGGTTSYTAAATSPFWQHTHAGNGGPCADTSQPCSKISMAHGSTHYTQPGELIGYVNSLQPGQWFTFQSFVLVTGSSNGYSTGGIAWDCTSTNPALHWTNDNERYCYNDFQTVVAAIAARGIQVTDPLSVGVAFGRPATYPTSTFVPSDTTPPSVPTNLRATADQGDTGVSLTWTAATDDVGVAGYDLERSTDGTTWTVVSADLTGTSYADSATAPDTAYEYRVKAYDAAGNASDYAYADVVTGDPPPPDTTAPTVPGDFVATPDTSDATVSLSWTASTDDRGVTAYRLERSTDQATWTVLTTVDATTYRDTTTGYGQQYFYRVGALDAAGNMSDYATTSATTPSAPQAEQYVGNPSVEGGSLSGWTKYSTTSAIADVAVSGGSEDGSDALQVANPGRAAGVVGLMDKAPHWVSNTVAGTAYTGSMWLHGPANTAVTIRLRECNATGTSCPASAAATVTLPVTGWAQASVPYVAKQAGDALRFSASASLPAKGTFLADAFSLTAQAAS